MKRPTSLTVLAAALSTAVLSSAAYIYSCGDAVTFIMFTIFSAIYTAALFLIFSVLKRKDKVIVSTITLIALFIVAVLIAQAVNDIRSGVELMQWFMDPRKFTRIYQGAAASIIIMFGYILDAAMFYFTKIQFRAAYIFLICMCPFSLFAKTFTDIPVVYTVIMTTLFFTLLMVSGGNKNSAGIITKISGTNIILAMTGFIAVVTVISAFFPKLDYAPYRKEFDELITGIQIGVEGVGDFNDFSNTSSSISSADDEKAKVVFKIYGEAPLYIKRQCFNRYNGKDNVWEYYGDANTGSPYWSMHSMYENPEALYDAVGFNGGETTVRECIISSVSDSIRALYTQENTLAMRFDEKYNISIYRTELSEYFLVNGLTEYPTRYFLEWADFELQPKFCEIFSDEKAMEVSDRGIIAARAYLSAKEEAKRYDDYLMNFNVRKECYKSEKGFNEVRELTDQITAECKNDYEKAKAIEQYFKSDQFVYDENFATSDASPENFIFRTKRGICTNYATAMTLMCREAGLTARYVEGFLRGEYNTQERCYALTVGDAHAYVQVWIDGYGWTDFDPTSGNIDGGYNSATFLFIGILAVIISVITVILIMTIPKIKRSRLMKRIREADTRSCYIITYNALSADYNLFAGIKQNSLAPTELAEKSREEIGADISVFISEYEKCVYGGEADGLSSDCVKICAEYRSHIRKTEKERRKALRAKKKAEKAKRRKKI